MLRFSLPHALQSRVVQLALLTAAMFAVAIGLFVTAGNLPNPPQAYHMATINQSQLTVLQRDNGTYLKVPVNDGRDERLLRIDGPAVEGHTVEYWEELDHHEISTTHYAPGWSIATALIGVGILLLAIGTGIYALVRWRSDH
jgi:hypothetical protein